MLAAETAVLFHFKSVRIILLIFLCVIIPLLAIGTSECNFDSHLSAPPNRNSGYDPVNTSLRKGARACPRKKHTKKALSRGTTIISHFFSFVNMFLKIFLYLL